MFFARPRPQPTRNPFLFGRVAQGEDFVGRADELAAIIREAWNRQACLVVSAPQQGKTSLALEAGRQLHAQGALVGYVDLGACDSKTDLVSQVATTILDDFVSPFGLWFRRILDTFSRLDIRPTISVGEGGGLPTATMSVAGSLRPHEPDRYLRHLLTLAEQIARKHKEPSVLFWDGAHDIDRLDPQLGEFLKSTVSRQRTTCHVFLGDRGPAMRRLFLNPRAPLHGMARVIDLGPIAKPDLRPYIETKFQTTGHPITPEALEAILDIVEGQPREVQELCHQAWETAERLGPATPVDARVLEASVKEMLAQDRSELDRTRARRRARAGSGGVRRSTQAPERVPERT